ncbi:MAG TPA: ATP-binding protein [Bacteroidales bacterium]|nr:ATP-binding protein [Bacteroidales bacterium]
MNQPVMKPRNLYLKRIEPHIRKNYIKVLTGLRRSGKSYLMLNLVEKINATDPQANIIYINKEHYEFDNIRDYHDLQAFFDNKAKSGVNNYFVVDEIQEIEEFQKCVRNVLSKNLADIYISGSNADLLSGELATLLSGRYVEIRVHPLSYVEFTEFFGLEYSDGTFNRYLKQGGLPGLLHVSGGEEPVNDYRKGILSTVLLKDIVARYNIRNISVLENLVRYLAGNIGSLVSAKNISDYLKSQRVAVSPNLVLDYLDHLCKAFFVNKVQRKEIAGKKIFEIGEKYYFEDTGLRNTVIAFRPGDIAGILENVVFNHLRIADYEVFVGKKDHKEVDFIAEKDGETIYVQVSYLLAGENVVERKFGNLASIPDNYKKFVVTMDKVTAPNTYKGIEHKYLPDFCRELPDGI